MPEVKIRQHRQKIASVPRSAYAGRSWAKGGLIVSHFDADGVAEVGVSQAEAIALHPEFEIVGDPFTVEKVVDLDSLDDLDLGPDDEFVEEIVEEPEVEAEPDPVTTTTVTVPADPQATTTGDGS